MLLTVLVLILSACNPPTPTPVEITKLEKPCEEPVGEALLEFETKKCVSFEDQQVGASYTLGNVFSEEGVRIAFLTFYDPGPTAANYAEIQRKGGAGGSGKDIFINNINIEFDFDDGSWQAIHFCVRKSGDTYNFDINKIPTPPTVVHSDLSEILLHDYSNVEAVFLRGYDDLYVIEIWGDINSFAMGGQELWLDEICLYK
jgi:hypothetical protein